MWLTNSHRARRIQFLCWVLASVQYCTVQYDTCMACVTSPKVLAATFLSSHFTPSHNHPGRGCAPASGIPLHQSSTALCAGRVYLHVGSLRQRCSCWLLHAVLSEADLDELLSRMSTGTRNLRIRSASSPSPWQKLLFSPPFVLNYHDTVKSSPLVPAMLAMVEIASCQCLQILCYHQ